MAFLFKTLFILPVIQGTKGYLNFVFYALVCAFYKTGILLKKFRHLTRKSFDDLFTGEGIIPREQCNVYF